jgi:hypothetical protein
LLGRLLDTLETVSMVQQARPNLHEVAELEVATAGQFVRHRLQALRVVLLAGYSVLLRRETAGAWPNIPPVSPVVKGDDMATSRMPAHLCRVLLVLGHEKARLAAVFGGMTVENGDGYSLGSSRVGDGADSSESSLAAWGYGASLNRGERYQDLLFRELCQGLLELYVDVVERIATDSLLLASSKALHTSIAKGGAVSGQDKKPGGPSPPCLHPLSLGQAREELGFLQVRDCLFITNISVTSQRCEHRLFLNTD